MRQPVIYLPPAPWDRRNTPDLYKSFAQSDDIRALAGREAFKDLTQRAIDVVSKIARIDELGPLCASLISAAAMAHCSNFWNLARLTVSAWF